MDAALPDIASRRTRAQSPTGVVALLFEARGRSKLMSLTTAGGALSWRLMAPTVAVPRESQSNSDGSR